MTYWKYNGNEPTRTTTGANNCLTDSLISLAHQRKSIGWTGQQIANYGAQFLRSRLPNSVSLQQILDSRIILLFLLLIPFLFNNSPPKKTKIKTKKSSL